MPQVLLRLLALSNDPNADFDEIAGLIEKDAALSVRVLRLASTPAYRQWNQVKDLRRLLTIIGSRSLRTLIVTSSIAQLFRQLAPDEAVLLQSVWRTSLRAAYCARGLAELSAYPSPEEAYVGGLVHRIGQLALLDVFPGDYRELLNAEIASSDLGKLERDRFGADHAILGGWLLQHWELDPLLADSVRYQFEPLAAVDSAHPLVRLVYLATRMADADERRDTPPGAAADRLFGLAESLVVDIARQADEQVGADMRLLGIDEQAPDADPPQGMTPSSLATELSRTSLLGAVRNELNETSDMDDLLLAIRRQLDLLFEIRHTLFFLPTNGGLAGRPQPDQDPEIARFSFPLDSDRGLFGQAISRGEVLDSCDDSINPRLSVLDRQIIGRLGGDGVLAMPLKLDQRVFGLMVLGVPAHHREAMAHQTELLGYYASQVAEVFALHERDRSERERSRLEDRARYEQQARKVVHEANNPLGIISNYLHVLGAKLESDHPSAEHIEVIREEIDRVGKILLRLPHSYDEEADDPGWIQIPTIVNQLVTVFQASVFKSKGIKAQLQLPADLPEVRGDRDKFKQIMVNLLKNAGEAVETGGTVQVTARDGINTGGRSFIEVCVVDDGPGVPAHKVDELFRPLGTEKGAGHSGLGLTIAANLARELGGQIIYRAHNPGACFQVLLPRLVREAADRSSVQQR